MNQVVTADEKAVLVHISFRNSEFNEELDEFIQLTSSSGIDAAQIITGRRDGPDARFFVGTGKVDEIRDQLRRHNARLVIFNHELSPGQERNIERALECRVLDRVGLILDIFAQRARSYEGKLQVELAQLQHLSTRLVRGWSHLERQKGGIGLRGPGETQLETDRRLIGKRIKAINGRLGKVKQQRAQSRRLRKRTGTPVVSMVGYTNAGKSTLFSRLTGANAYVADQLFATLDPSLRKMPTGPQRHVVLSDTVGFIQHIPHDLVEAFHATLEEICQADLLLHVIDAAAEERQVQRRQVDQVIEEIAAEHVPQIIVYNKIDLRSGSSAKKEQHNGAPPTVWLSARTGDGIDLLRDVIDQYLFPSRYAFRLRVPAAAGNLRAGLIRAGRVQAEQEDGDGGWLVTLNIDASELRRICTLYGWDADALLTDPQ